MGFRAHFLFMHGDETMAVRALEQLLERTLAGLGLRLADFEYIN